MKETGVAKPLWFDNAWRRLSVLRAKILWNMSAVVKLVNESSTNAMYGASLSNRSYALNAPFAMRRAVMKYSSRRRNRDVFIFGLVVESRKKKSAYVITLHSRSGKTRREILFSLTLVTLFYAISFQLDWIYLFF